VEARKKQKGHMLDELVALTGYHRWYAVGLLRGHGASPDERRGRINRRARQRPRVYDAAVLTALRRIWVVMDCICGKRLAPVLPEMIAVLERHGELQLDPATRQKLGAISAASIDRLLAAERRRLNVRGRSGTKPGTLLKHQIPVRTFAEWDQSQPGFVEIDLVGHDGGFALSGGRSLGRLRSRRTFAPDPPLVFAGPWLVISYSLVNCVPTSRAPCKIRSIRTVVSMGR
jgi:hypothetical protein